MSPVHRAPAALKLGLALALIMGLAALPAEHPLLLIARLARLQLRSLLVRWAAGAPFLLGVASLALFQPHGLQTSLGLLVRAAICLLALQLLASVTPIS